MTKNNVRKLEYSEFAELSAELIDNSDCLRFRAHGRSMLPTIHNGDILTVEKTEPANLSIGNIVMIQNATNSILAHRIIKRNHYVETPHLSPLPQGERKTSRNDPAKTPHLSPLPQGERKGTKNEDTWTTCGDALQMHDEPFTADQLIGIVRIVEHNGKEKSLCPFNGRLMAILSRHSTSVISRVIKRLMRVIT